MKEDRVAHTLAEHAARYTGFVPRPVPGGKHSGQNELAKGCDKVESPVQREQVEPLEPECFGGLLVLGELALDGTVNASLKKFKFDDFFLNPTPPK